MKCQKCSKLFDEKNSLNIRTIIRHSGKTSFIYKCPHCKASNTDSNLEDKEILSTVYPEILDKPSGNKGEMLID